MYTPGSTNVWKDRSWGIQLPLWSLKCSELLSLDLLHVHLLKQMFIKVFPASRACKRGRNGGPGYSSWCQFHAQPCDSVFLFVPDSATVFLPSHPLVSSCLKFIEVYQHLGSFFPVIDSNSVIIVLLIETSIKCCYTWHSVCEKVCSWQGSSLRNISKTSASVSSGLQPHAFIVFESLETPMKHEAQVFEITSPTKEN